MNQSDPDDLEREVGRPPLKDRSYFGNWLWWRSYVGPAPGEATDFGWRGALVSLAFIAAFFIVGWLVVRFAH